MGCYFFIHVRDTTGGKEGDIKLFVICVRLCAFMKIRNTKGGENK